MVKMKNKLQKPFPTGDNLLIAQDLWQVCYRILEKI